MNRSHRASPHPSTPEQSSRAGLGRTGALEASLVLSLVHRQLEGEGRLSVPLLARAADVSEGTVLHTLTELLRRGWLELAREAPYVRITPQGNRARQG